MEDEILKELEAPMEKKTATQPSGTAISDTESVVLVREVDSDGISSDEGAFDLGDIIAEGIEEVAEQQKRAGSPVTAQAQQSFQIDDLTATAAAVFYTEILLPGLVGSLGELFAGDSYKYRSMGKKFDEVYRKTTTELLKSGEIKLPTPMQCFMAMTAAIVISNAIQVFQIRKKKAKRIQVEQKRDLTDESKPVEIPEPQPDAPIKSDATVEAAKRKKFTVESGFYMYDLEGVYIKKQDRRYGPSDIAKVEIAKTSVNAEIKEAIKKALKK